MLLTVNKLKTIISLASILILLGLTACGGGSEPEPDVELSLIHI